MSCSTRSAPSCANTTSPTRWATGLRPGCLADASDDAQFAELDTLGELVQRARAAGVHVMVDGPATCRSTRIRNEHEAPAGGLRRRALLRAGPGGDRRFPGYDHITSAIGATCSRPTGAPASCATSRRPSTWACHTRRRQARLHRLQNRRARRRRGPQAARRPPVGRRDLAGPARTSIGRNNSSWPSTRRRRAIRSRDLPGGEEYCSMCGRQWCAVRLSKEVKESLAQKEVTPRPKNR